MTMPHLSNCPHNPDGWCLDCVKELHAINAELFMAARRALSVLRATGHKRDGNNVLAALEDAIAGAKGETR